MKRLLLVWMLLLMPACAQAIPIAEIRDSVTVITLTDEPCAFKEHVTNLPFRTTWAEGGKVIEGCAGGMLGAIVAWYSDRTVAWFPVAAFTKVQGT